MKSVLITGGTGFFGRAFVRRLLAMPRWEKGTVFAFEDIRSYEPSVERICVYSRDEHKQAQMREEFGDDKRLRFFIGDVRDEDRLARAMLGCDTVIHAAALKRIEVGHYNPDEMVKTNVNGAMNVIEAAFITGIERVVYLSSDKAFEPVSPYGQTKALAESLFLAANRNLTAHGTRFSVTRYGNVAGSTGSVIPRWREQLREKGYLTVTDLEATRFWMSVAEAVDLVLQTLHTMPNEIAVPVLPAFQLGDLAHVMAKGREIVVTGLPPFEKLHESMLTGRSSDAARRLSRADLDGLLENI